VFARARPRRVPHATTATKRAVWWWRFSAAPVRSAVMLRTNAFGSRVVQNARIECADVEYGALGAEQRRRGKVLKRARSRRRQRRRARSGENGAWARGEGVGTT